MEVQAGKGEREGGLGRDAYWFFGGGGGVDCWFFDELCVADDAMGGI